MQSDVNLPLFLTNELKMEVVRLFETLVDICRITRRHSPRKKLIYSNSRDNVNSDSSKLFLEIAYLL